MRKNTDHTYRQAGFSLIELLIVIGIITVLVVITFIAINPARQSSHENNTKRRNDVNRILNAVNQYMANNQGTIPAGVTTSIQPIANTGANICSILVPQYAESLPRDPLISDGVAITDCAIPYDTNYAIVQSATDSRITVNAPGAELGESISVTQ